MALSGWRGRLASRWGIALAVVVVLLGTVVAVAVSRGRAHVTTRAQFVTGTPEAGRPVRLDTTLYLPRHTPAPAVLLSPGFGDTKTDLAGEAKTLARHGYVVLAYTARGFGASGGLIHLDSPRYEVHDAHLLVSYLAGLPQVQRRDGKARIAVAGSSYGGALALLLAATDKRIEAVGADITWNNLVHALFPNGVGSAPGVFKRMWAGYLFESGLRVGGSDPGCGRFAPDVCAAYRYAARTGRPNAALLTLLRASSPSGVLDRITVPTLLTQGEQDSLFPLSEADANARGISAHGTPVRVEWRLGGHDDPSAGTGTATGALVSWLGSVFGGGVHGKQPFEIEEPGAVVSSSEGGTATRELRVAGYPGLPGSPVQTRTVAMSGPAQRIAAPAGGVPAAVSSLPGLGGLLSAASELGGSTQFGLDQLSGVPGQLAAFASAPLSGRTLLAGAGTARLTVTSSVSGAVTLFVALRDVSGTNVQLPDGLVQPVYLTGMRAGAPRTVTVRLPSVFADVAAGHRLVLTVSSTDLGYQLPTDPRTYTVAAAGSVVVPVVHAVAVRTGTPLAWPIGGALVLILSAATAVIVVRRRRSALHPDPELAAVPIVISELSKQYGDGYKAVNAVSFRVETGQVVGLLGPNGAGKTTTLRMLVGLITPTAGTIHVFGEPVAPGASVLARLGAFIEGPGFLPHLTGRENLRLYWAATGRPEQEASVDTALRIAGLGESIQRRVRTYSHGMTQRLGIAQAMLGLPEVLVLDEPTNGLDPPQIAEMRDVVRAYAATGRTVVLSSHLLAEVEQTCSHVVVMHKGRLVAAGSVAEIAGRGGSQLAVDDPEHAVAVLAAAGITARTVPVRRALEDVFLDLIGEDATP